MTRFTKGHGTENDFVLVPDLEGSLELTPAQVQRIADRHAGLGADGVIRVVRTAHATDETVRAQAPEAEDGDSPLLQRLQLRRPYQDVAPPGAAGAGEVVSAHRV